MAKNYNFPEDKEQLIEELKQILSPISPATSVSEAQKDFLFTAQRTDEGRDLPPYYLCYFLFVDLLGFRNLGQFEKVAWSVPIEFEGVAYLLEHRKLGFGLFARDKESQSLQCKKIVKIINKATVRARPYFEWYAQECAKNAALNVHNYSQRLFERFNYYLSEYERLAIEAEERKSEQVIEKLGKGFTATYFPATELRKKSQWSALSAIDAFFSWTEHIFIHAAVLKGRAKNAEDIHTLAEGEWAVKFREAIDISVTKHRIYYDQLVIVKRQIRNYLAHGSFGKQGEAFQIHTGAGAVPLLMPHQKGSAKFSFQENLSFKESDTIGLIKEFVEFYWDSALFTEVEYIKSGLPSILTMVNDGTYSRALQSNDSINELVDYLLGLSDQSANMDW